MKLAVHICSFNGKDYQKRFIYLKKIVKNYFAISKKIKIFIHTNKISEKYKIKNIEYIAHDLKNENPFYLSWKCRSLIEKQKIVLGGSSGINIAGAIKLAKKIGPGKTIVTILCDHGKRYASKIFNKDFLKSKNLPIPKWL